MADENSLTREVTSHMLTTRCVLQNKESFERRSLEVTSKDLWMCVLGLLIMLALAFPPGEAETQPNGGTQAAATSTAQR